MRILSPTQRAGVTGIACFAATTPTLNAVQVLGVAAGNVIPLPTSPSPQVESGQIYESKKDFSCIALPLILNEYVPAI